MVGPRLHAYRYLPGSRGRPHCLVLLSKRRVGKIGATLKVFSAQAWHSLHPSDTFAEGVCYAESGEGRMTLILGFPVAALLVATGIYNPQPMHNGRCMAEPGGIYALYY